MSDSSRRSEVRMKAHLHAFVSGIDTKEDVKCLIRDISEGGCRIVSSRIHKLPDLIELTPEGFNRPLRAKIVWRSEKMAGIQFEHALENETQAEFEKSVSRLSGNTGLLDDILELGKVKKISGYADRMSKYKFVEK